MVPAYCDAVGYQVPNRGIVAAKHDILAGGLEIIVLDRERPRPVPAANRLGVLTDALAVGNMRIADRHSRGVQRDAALLSDVTVPMHVDVIEDDVMWNQGQ